MVMVMRSSLLGGSMLVLGGRALVVGRLQPWRRGASTGRWQVSRTRTQTAAEPAASRCTERLVEEEEAGGEETTRAILVEKSEWDGWLESSLTASERKFVEASLPGGWKAGSHALVASFSDDDSATAVSRVVCCCEGPLSTAKGAMEAGAVLATSLPARRTYLLERADLDEKFACLGWSLGAYSFERYKKPDATKVPPAVLMWPRGLSTADKADVELAARATYKVRDLISTPAEDMGPAALSAALKKIADETAGTFFDAIVGDDLLEKNYPQVHAVGRAGAPGREPRVAVLEWRPEQKSSEESELPTLVLVGKGVTFDTGGLNIKPGTAMGTMKKDMGGAAHVVGLAEMIVASKLRVNLVALLGCAENSIAGAAFRPGDVLTARDGTTTEILNTDAEGRLVLADLLVDAVHRKPDLVVDLATLTGAGRVALGTDVPALFCNNDDIALDLQRISATVNDQLWRLPLWAGYENELRSPIADLKNIGNGPYGGAITAALYLQHFIKTKPDTDSSDDLQPPPWIHIDLMAYNTKSSPGKPEGGEAMGLRALFEFLKLRYPPSESGA